MMVHDDDVALHPAPPHFGDKALVPRTALLPQAGICARVQLVPQRAGFGQLRQLGAIAALSVQPLLNLWPTPTANDLDFASPSTCPAPTNCGIAEVFSSPLQTIREDFGTARVDHIFSQRDTFGGIYTIDDGQDFTATPLDPFSSDTMTLREQALTLEETHVSSPALVNSARVGFSRAGYFFTAY